MDKVHIFFHPEASCRNEDPAAEYPLRCSRNFFVLHGNSFSNRLYGFWGKCYSRFPFQQSGGGEWTVHRNFPEEYGEEFDGLLKEDPFFTETIIPDESGY